MGGKRSAQPVGTTEGAAAASGDADAVQERSVQRRIRGLSVGGGAGLAEALSCGQEESGSMTALVQMSLSMRCDTRELAGRKAALGAAVEAALQNVVTDFGGWDVKVEWTRVGPSADTLQRVLPCVLDYVSPEGGAQCFQVCHPFTMDDS